MRNPPNLQEHKTIRKKRQIKSGNNTRDQE
jgi:hypothetical protein